jgi:hypothetical protein
MIPVKKTGHESSIVFSRDTLNFRNNVGWKFPEHAPFFHTSEIWQNNAVRTSFDAGDHVCLT